MSLDQIQKNFIEFLYTPRPLEAQKDLVRSFFLNPKSPDPHNGLKIYRSNLVFGLIGAMKETYAFTRVLLGENNFNFFCRDFLYQNPSHNTDLIQYGAGFGEFLATREEIRHLAFIADVARLEWALERVFYSKPEDSFLGEMPENWREMKPQFKSSVYLIQTQHKIHEAWLNFTEKGEEGIRADMFKKEPEYLVVWADKGSPQITPVSQSLAFSIEEIIQGKTASSMAKSAGFLEENILDAYCFAIRQGWIAR